MKDGSRNLEKREEREDRMGRREIAKRVGRIQQPLLWETEYVAAEQNLETIGFFSARYTRPSLRE